MPLYRPEEAESSVVFHSGTDRWSLTPTTMNSTPTHRRPMMRRYVAVVILLGCESTCRAWMAAPVFSRARHKPLASPVNSRCHSRTTAMAASTDQDHDELPDKGSISTVSPASESMLERYKNRAMFLQHVVQEKLSQLTLANSKVVFFKKVTKQLASKKNIATLQLL